MPHPDAGPALFDLGPQVPAFDAEQAFEAIWRAYPLRVGRKAALRHYRASVTTAQRAADCTEALRLYAAHLELRPWKEPQNGSTWFNNWQDWTGYEDPKARPVSAAEEHAPLSREEIFLDMVHPAALYFLSRNPDPTHDSASREAFGKVPDIGALRATAAIDRWSRYLMVCAEFGVDPYRMEATRAED